MIESTLSRIRQLEKLKHRGEQYPLPLFGDHGVYTFQGKEWSEAELMVELEKLGFNDAILIDDNIPFV